jgi:hypothetical protein
MTYYLGEGDPYEYQGGGPYPPYPGTRFHRYRCSLPGLTGFTISRRGGAGTGHHKGGEY